MKANSRSVVCILAAIIVLDFILSGLLGWFQSPIYAVVYLGLVFILLLIKPRWGVPFLIATATLDTVNIYALRPYQWMLVFAAFAPVARNLLERKNIFQLFRKRFLVLISLVQTKDRRLLFPLLSTALLGGSLLGVLNAGDKGYALKQAAVLAACLFIALAVYFWVLAVKNGASRATRVVLASSLPIAVFALYQNIAHERGWQSFEVMAARPNSTFYEPDWLGMYQVVVLALLFGWYSFRLIGRANKNVERLGLSAFVALHFVVLVITVARASWLGVALSLAAAMAATVGAALLKRKRLMIFKKSAAGFLSFAAIAALAVLLVNTLKLTRFNLADRAASIYRGEHIVTIAEGGEPREKIKINLEEIEAYRNRGYKIYEEYVSDVNVDARHQAFASMKEIALEHPFLGQGQGSVLARTNFVDNANNIFYEWWISAGLFGLIGFAGLLVWPVWRASRLLVAGPNLSRAAAGLAVSAIAGVAGLAVANVFNSGIFFAPLWVFLGLIWGGLAKKEG